MPILLARCSRHFGKGSAPLSLSSCLPPSLQAVACFNAKAHHKKAKELYFIGQVAKGPFQIAKSARNKKSLAKFKTGEWAVQVNWFYPVDGQPLCYSDTAPAGKSSLDTIHLESIITVLDESRSHHTPLPLQMKRGVGGQWELTGAAHAALTDPSRVDLYQGRDPAEKD